MTIPNTWVLSYVRERDMLYSSEKISHFLQALARQNCYVASELEIGFFTIWKRFLVEAPTASATRRRAKRSGFEDALQPGVSELLREEVRLYSTQRQEELTFSICSMARTELLRGFQVTCTLQPVDGCILLSVEAERFFGSSKPGLAKYQHWLELVRTVYACWQPLFVHEFSHTATVPNTSWEEVQAFAISQLYMLNIFGPELVEKIGQQKLLFVPAWKVAKLKDDGILVIPEDSYSSSEQHSYSLRRAAKYLGFPVSADESDEPGSAFNTVDEALQ